MKASKIFLILFAGIIGFVSCAKEDTSPVLTTVEASSIDNLPSTSYPLTEPELESNPLAFTITWTETMFHLDDNTLPYPLGPVIYSVEIDKVGNNFATPQTLAGTTTLSANIFVKDLNGIVLDKFAATPGESIALEMRVVTLYGTNGIEQINSANTFAISVTPYDVTTEVFPVYLIGDMNGWDNTNTDYIMFRESNDPKNHIYTYTGRFAAGTYFKFIPKESLGTYKAYCKKDETTLVYEESETGSFYNETEGYKTITIDTKTLEYTIVDYDASAAKSFTTLGPIGGFCAWDNEPAMTVSDYDSHQWRITYTFIEGTALKFRGNKDWANNWGGSDIDFAYGKAVFDGPGATVPAGTYTIYFNDLTGHYVIQK